jgi:hypothetical protein
MQRVSAPFMPVAEVHRDRVSLCRVTGQRITGGWPVPATVCAIEAPISLMLEYDEISTKDQRIRVSNRADDGGSRASRCPHTLYPSSATEPDRPHVRHQHQRDRRRQGDSADPAPANDPPNGERTLSARRGHGTPGGADWDPGQRRWATTYSTVSYPTVAQTPARPPATVWAMYGRCRSCAHRPGPKMGSV